MQYSLFEHAFSLCDRASVMGQLDPNNVSGLLKFHLRQNSVLSSTALAVSQDALAETCSEGERTRVSSVSIQSYYLS